MAYLNCPTCRLTVYVPTLSVASDDCPRCRARLGKASRLFRSAMPPRVLQATRAAQQARERASDEAIAR
jgi:uncharacterized paraquat-inducible protein A